MIKTKKHLAALFFLTLIGLPQAVSANSLIVSTVKNPDPYNGNSSWFRYYEYPGTTIKDSIILRNIGKQAESVKLYAADATSNDAGSFSPKMENEEQKGIGIWTTLSKKEVTLTPGQSEEVSFEIKIPQEITPGQYFGSIIYEESGSSACPVNEKISGFCAGSIQIKTRSGNRVYLTIPGEAKHDIKLLDFKWKKSKKDSVYFSFSFLNNGNVAFEPKAVISIYNSWGQKIDTVETKLGKSLPMTSMNPTVEWDYKENWGNFTAKAEIYYLEDNQGRVDSLRGTVLSEKKQINLYVIPWMSIAYILGIILIIGVGVCTHHLYYLHINSTAIRYTVKKDENLVDLAERFNTRWQIIAHINKLRAPYVISENQVIKIPHHSAKKNEK